MDRAAFGQLCERNKDQMYRLAFGILQDQQLAEDAVQEGLTRIFTIHSSLEFDNERVELAYTLHTVRNVSISMKKHDEFGRHFIKSSEDVPYQDAAYKIVSERETISEIFELIGPQAQAIFSFRAKGLSDNEISKTLGISVENVRTIAYRARKQLSRKKRKEGLGLWTILIM